MLGFFVGPAKAGQEIMMEAPSPEPTPEGRYVLLQKDNAGVDGDDQQLHVEEFEAFGIYDDQIEGVNQIIFGYQSLKNNITITISSLYFRVQPVPFQCHDVKTESRQTSI